MENKRIFDYELEKLRQKLVLMCSRVKNQVADALTALKENNLDLALKVIVHDNDIDSLDVKIDKLCQKIFALQQPVASDLRFIMSALRINNDLERIGDHAVQIAKGTEILKDFPFLIQNLGIDKAGDRILLLLPELLELLQTYDQKKCDEIFRYAACLKEECESIGDKILTEMLRKSEVVTVAPKILGVLNHMDRIAGYSVNITESVIFIVEGEIVRHRRNPEFPHE